MPARRRKNKQKILLYRRLVLILLMAALSMSAFLLLRTKYWRRDNKLNLIIAQNSGEVVVGVFDPQAKSITKIIIPGNTEVQLARQLGRWKLASVWKLGLDEGLGGKLLAETVTKNFKVPAVGWADSNASGLLEGDMRHFVKSVLAPYKTNLGLGDRLRLFLFSLTVKEFKRIEIPLKDTQYLKKEESLDGESGYRVREKVPDSLLVVFSDYEFSKGNYKVSILDESGKAGTATEVGEIVEVTGAKVTSVVSAENKDYDCYVLSNEEKKSKRIADIFSCKILDEKPMGSFDMVIKIGERFPKRF